MRLANKTALITGGNSGLGLATAKLFVAEGAKVIITGRNQETLRAGAKELGPNALAVAPGPAQIRGAAIATPEAEKAFEARIGRTTPLGRIGEPDHVAKTVLFLASDEAGHIQGQELFIDGGATSSPSGAPIYRA